MEVSMSIDKLLLLAIKLDKAIERIATLESQIKQLASINDVLIQSLKELSRIVNDLAATGRNR
jgi:hypothetical protein